jgi:SAM-dependent methyltransferase
MFNKKKTINSLELYNSKYSKLYRGHDDIVGNSEIFKYFDNTITKITTAFPAKINVLDIGCGTGRYFSSVKNAYNLVGIDTSVDMLNYAKTNPFKCNEITANNLEFFNIDILNYDTNYQFDFIYSIGVLGEHAFFDYKTFKKIDSLLNINGVLFITLQSGESLPMGKKHLIYKYIFDLLPFKLKMSLSKCILNYPFLYKKDIKYLLSMFNYEIDKFIDFNTKTDSWNGSHYHLILKKK